MTSKKLAEIERRTAMATPGPWAHEISAEWGGTGLIWQHRSDWEEGMYTSPRLKTIARCEYVHTGWNARPLEQTDADAEFIAHARTDIPALINEIDRLHEALQKIFWILNKGSARIWPEKTIKAASDIARDAQAE